MLHSDIQLRLAVPTDPTLQTTGATSHLRSESEFQYRARARPGHSRYQRRRPRPAQSNHQRDARCQLQLGRLRRGLSPRVSSTSTTTPASKKLAACSSKAPPWSRFTARFTRARSPSSCVIRTSIRDAREPYGSIRPVDEDWKASRLFWRACLARLEYQSRDDPRQDREGNRESTL